MQRVRVSTAILAVLTCVAPGCSGGPPKEVLVPVSGTVKVGGKAVEGVQVSFRPLPGTPGNGGSGETDEDGEYEVMHSATQQPGIPKGKYSVHFSLYLTKDGKPAPEGVKPQKSGARESIAKEWSDVTDVATHNTVTVPEGGKTFDFEISQAKR